MADRYLMLATHESDLDGPDPEVSETLYCYEEVCVNTLENLRSCVRYTIDLMAFAEDDDDVFSYLSVNATTLTAGGHLCGLGLVP